MRTTTMMAALALGALTVTACSDGPSEEEQRARDLQMAMNGYPNQLVSPAELGRMPSGAPGYGAATPVAYVQTPQGLVPVYSQQMPAPAYPAPAYPAPAPVYSQQPMVVQAAAPAPRATATATRTATRAPEKVTHVKRDAAIGAAVGTIAGAAIGKDVKGALIGAAAGGLLGAVVGATVDVQHR